MYGGCSHDEKRNIKSTKEKCTSFERILVSSANPLRFFLILTLPYVIDYAHSQNSLPCHNLQRGSQFPVLEGVGGV